MAPKAKKEFSKANRLGRKIKSRAVCKKWNIGPKKDFIGDYFN